MWEMQVLSSQKNNNNSSGSSNKNGEQDASNHSGGGECGSGEDRLNGGESHSGGEAPMDHQSTHQSHDQEHPALRGVPPGTTSPISSDLVGQLSPTSALNGNGASALAAGGRKRPLLAGGPRSSMTPTKRTVMSLLARARAAQAKHISATGSAGPAAAAVAAMSASSMVAPQTAATCFARTAQERAPTLVPLLRDDYITGAVNLNLI